MKYPYMRSLYLILCIGIFLNLTTGCKKLDPIIYHEYSPSNFPKTDADVQAMVLSCYQPLNSWNTLGVQFWLENMTNTVIGAYGLQLACRRMDYDVNTQDLSKYYYNSSQISRATLVIDAIENSELSEEVKKRYIAEVRCARAFLMYLLYDIYGGLVIAPVDILKNPLKDTPLPRATNKETAEFIESDLLAAIDGLPYPNAAVYGRLNKGVANMLLIRLYLKETMQYQFGLDGSVISITKHPEYYSKVETLCRELMKGEYGYALAANYTDLFTVGKQNATRTEMIFAIPSSIDGPNTHYWQLQIMPTNLVSSRGGNLAGWQTLSGYWAFYDSFEPSDTRKTYMLEEYLNTDGQMQNRANPGEPLKFGPVPLKYFVDPDINKQSLMSLADRVFFRYADVYLSLAEALVYKPGGLVNQEVVDLLNVIRKRANLGEITVGDIPTKERFQEVILLERAHELWCENGQYRADLIRFDKLLDVILEINGGQAPRARKYKYLWPIPHDVIVDGKGKVNQNPGY